MFTIGVCFAQTEKFKVVTILFSNVVGFCDIAANVEPMKVVHLLNTIYSIMDLILAKHNVYKVSQSSKRLLLRHV